MPDLQLYLFQHVEIMLIILKTDRLFLLKWIPCQAVTSVLCLLFRPKTVHCSTKHAYTCEITFLALVPCIDLIIYYLRSITSNYILLGNLGALRPSSILTFNFGSFCEPFLFVQYKTITKNFEDFLIFFCGISKFYENNFVWIYLCVPYKWILFIAVWFKKNYRLFISLNSLSL